MGLVTGGRGHYVPIGRATPAGRRRDPGPREGIDVRMIGFIVLVVILLATGFGAMGAPNPGQRCVASRAAAV